MSRQERMVVFPSGVEFLPLKKVWCLFGAGVVVVGEVGVCWFFLPFFLSALEHAVYFSRLVGKIPCKLCLKTSLLSSSRNSVPFHVYI